MEDIEKIFKGIAKYVEKAMKLLIAKLGLWILVPIAGLFIIGLMNFEASGATSKTASKSAEIIASSITIENGEIKIDDTVYEKIREDLKEQEITPESYYLGKKNKCQDGSGLTYLEKMVQAEVVSNYPDTGKGDIRGIVKIHRNGAPLTYTDLADFENRVTVANNNQQSADVNSILNLFTIDESWNIIVATSSQTTETDELGETTTTYTVTTNPINYQMLVSQYTIPYEFLFVLMQTTNNPEYVSAVADLALKGEIILDIKDSTTTETITETEEWTEETVVRKTDKYAKVQELANAEWKSETKTTETKSKSSTTVNSMTTIDVKITKADTWAYTKEANYIQTTTTHEPMDETTEMEEELGEETVTTKASGSQYYKEGTTLNIIDKKVIYTGNTNSTEWVAQGTNEAINTIDFLGLWRNKEGKYTSPYSSEYSEGINDYVTEEDGGLEVMYKVPVTGTYKAPIDNIINEYESADIFFHYLSLNERTQNIETLMRYMLYKYTGKDYGVTDEDLASLLSVFRESEFYLLDGSFVGDSIEAKLWFALKGAGFSDEKYDFAVAGAIGNLAYESGGLNSSAVESNGVGVGLAQWSYDRRTALEAYATSKGTSWNDEDTQIEFLITEITGSGAARDYASKQFMSKSYKGKTYNETTWKNATTVEEATTAFCVSWERPADPEYSLTKTPYKSRIEYAQEIYDRYHGKTYGGIASGGSGAITTTFTSGITGRTFTMVNQNKTPGWSDKCNRAASMCIVSAYTKKSNSELIQEINSYGNGIPYGANGERYFNQYGLTRSFQNKENHSSALSAQLRSGGYALVHCKNNFKGKSGTKWSSAMHWVAIIGYRNESGKEQIYVADPASSSRCGWYDIDEFDNNKSGYVNYLIFVREK